MNEINLTYLSSVLAIALFLSWSYLIYRIRKYNKINDQSLKNLSSAKKIIKHLKEEILSSRKKSSDAAKSAQESAEVAKQMVDCLLDQDIPLEAMSNLNSSQKTLIDQLDALSNEQNHDDREKKQLKIHVATLKAQAQATETMIDRLKKEIEANRYTLSHLEDKLDKSEEKIEHLEAIKNKAKNVLSKNAELNQQVRHQSEQLQEYSRLEQQHSSLKKIKQHLERTINKQKHALEHNQQRIIALQSMLDQSQSVSTKNPEPFDQSMEDEIDQLTQKVSVLATEVSETEGALERANREKEFLETQFLVMIDSLEQANDTKHELTRVKKEYSMLEERFIMMHEESN